MNWSITRTTLVLHTLAPARIDVIQRKTNLFPDIRETEVSSRYFQSALVLKTPLP